MRQAEISWGPGGFASVGCRLLTPAAPSDTQICVLRLNFPNEREFIPPASGELLARLNDTWKELKRSLALGGGSGGADPWKKQKLEQDMHEGYRCVSSPGDRLAKTLSVVCGAISIATSHTRPSSAFQERPSPDAYLRSQAAGSDAGGVLRVARGPWDVCRPAQHV